MRHSNNQSNDNEKNEDSISQDEEFFDEEIEEVQNDNDSTDKITLNTCFSRMKKGISK